MVSKGAACPSIRTPDIAPEDVDSVLAETEAGWVPARPTETLWARIRAAGLAFIELVAGVLDWWEVRR